MEINFSGKVVLVAGGTGGLGHAVSRAFLEEGAKVVVTYRKEDEFADLKKAAGAKAAALEGAVVDVTDEGAVKEFDWWRCLAAWKGGCAGEYGRRLCRRSEVVGDGDEGLRYDAGAESAFGLCACAGVVPAMLTTEAWIDCECGG